MRTPPRILVVDDIPANIDIARARLESQGYEVITAADGEEALVQAQTGEPDLILLDIMMPKLDGLSVLKKLKQDATRFVPIILLTAKADHRDVIAGFDAGGDDYLTKPFDQGALVARVRAMLRIKELHDLVQEQKSKLADQAAELASWNRALEDRVAGQLEEIERANRLRRFLAPQVADMIASADGHANMLQSHRREITAMFCDLRGFTPFTDNTEPEEVISVLSEYHRTIGELIDRYEGTLERFAGDGILTLFNDPIPCEDHVARAVRMALDMRESVGRLTETWRKRGHNLGFGIGIAVGFATLGQIGFERRREYAAIGSVTNLASRLCDVAQANQIVVSQRTFGMIEGSVEATPLGDLTLKGFNRPMAAFAIERWHEGTGG